LRLRGKGVQKSEGSGDLIVTLQIRLPEGESEAADHAVEALDALYGDGPRSALRI
jgi:DnaJ-class molecular chaperone